MWDEFERVSKRLRGPLYRVVGDHDVWDKTSEKIYKKRYGKLYYSFDHKGSHFIILNSELEPRKGAGIGSSQLEWLRNDLEAYRQATHKFVFVHRTLWSETKQA